MTDELEYVESDDASTYQYTEIELDDSELKIESTSASLLDMMIELEKEQVAHSLILGDLTGKYNSVADELHRVKVLTTISLCLIAGSMVATFLCILASFGYL